MSAYGSEGGCLVMGSFMASAEHSLTEVPLTGAEVPCSVDVYYDSELLDTIETRFDDGTVRLKFNAASSATDIAAALPRRLVHEHGHVAHYRAVGSSALYGQTSTINAVVKESIARRVEAAVCGRLTGRPDIQAMNVSDHRRFRQGIVNALICELPQQRSGTGTVLRAVPLGVHYYDLGEYLVGMHAAQYGLSPAESTAISFDEYRDFARELA